MVKAETLKKELKQKVPEAKTILLIWKKILNLKNMDKVTTAGEIVKAITSAILDHALRLRGKSPPSRIRWETKRKNHYVCVRCGQSDPDWIDQDGMD